MCDVFKVLVLYFIQMGFYFAIVTTTSCSKHFDCNSSRNVLEQKNFCCVGTGQCCTDEEYLMGSRSCETNLDCPTDVNYYYCCVSTHTCCNYDSYKVSTRFLSCIPHLKTRHAKVLVFAVAVAKEPTVQVLPRRFNFAQFSSKRKRFI